MANINNPTDYAGVIKMLKNNQILPIYVLTGEETYLIESLIKNIETKCLNKASIDLDYIKYQGDKTPNINIDELIQQMRTAPFFSSRRVFLLRNMGWFTGAAAKNSANLELLEAISSQKDNVCLIFWENKVDKIQRKLIAKIKEVGALVDCETPKANELSAWINGYAHHLGLKISAEASAYIAGSCNDSMLLISNEFKKIQLYCQNQGLDTIDLNLVSLICPPDLNRSIFQLTDSLSGGHIDIALDTLDRLIAQPEPILKILTMLARHIKILILAKFYNDSSQFAKEAKLHPFVAQKAQTQSRNFAINKLNMLYDECFKADWAIKTGKMEERLAIELLLYKFK